MPKVAGSSPAPPTIMNTSFQKTTASDNWATPWEIVNALGKFDLDPCCAPENAKAEKFYTIENDGLTQKWGGGRVWCNPPYSQPALYQFCQKMAEHGNGILLIFARTGNKVWQEIIFQKATAVLFLRKRIRFIGEDGEPGGSAGCDSALVAFGWENVAALEKCGIEGSLIVLK